MYFKFQSDQPCCSWLTTLNFKVHQDAHFWISFYFIFLKTVSWKRIKGIVLNPIRIRHGQEQLGIEEQHDIACAYTHTYLNCDGRQITHLTNTKHICVCVCVYIYMLMDRQIQIDRQMYICIYRQIYVYMLPKL